MEPVNNNTRKKNMTLSVVALLITAGIAFLLFSSLKQMDEVNITAPNKSGSILSAVQENKLLQYDELLHTRLNNLQELDNQFADLVGSTAQAKNYDSLNMIILQQEESFRKSMDSVNRQAKTTGEAANPAFLKMLGAFKSVLESRKIAGSLRNAVAISQSSFTPDEKALFKLQQELMTKTNRVTTLENSLSAMEKKMEEIPAQVTASLNAKFADSIKFVANINVLENKIAGLTANLNNLRQENDKLEKQLAESSKTATASDALLREKNNLQQRINSLNAELQLATVDCTLTRADAAQAISNNKQRKVLLGEASSILTDLSATGNAEVKRKAQEKIARLNQITANTKD
jgi:predicted  nucleic acid-binding Zn-ribbon protein